MYMSEENKKSGNKKRKEVKVAVTFTDGYQQRYTQACLDVIRKRELRKENKDVSA